MDARELEIRCEECDAGFAAGTARCIHCGRPLGRRARAARAAEGPFDPTAETGEDADEELRGTGLWGNLFPLLAALGFGLSFVARACSEQ